MNQVLVNVISQKEICPGIYRLSIESTEIAHDSRPGQFVMISSDGSSERLLRRPISVNKVDESRIDFIYSSIGEGTKWLSGRKSGEKIDILGPMGSGFTIHPESNNLLLVAGGLGIAPLGFLAETSLKQGKSVKLLIGAKANSLLIPENFLPKGIKPVITTEDGSAGIKGMITDLLPEQAIMADQIFVCGPLPMYKSINKNYLNYLKGKPVQVSLEVRMGCGLGFCYACTIKTRQGLKQVCKDGPVFNLEDIIWDEL